MTLPSTKSSRSYRRSDTNQMSPPLLVLALAVSGASQVELVRRSFVSVSSSPDSASAVPKRNAPHGALNGGSRKLSCIEAVRSELFDEHEAVRR